MTFKQLSSEEDTIEMGSVWFAVLQDFTNPKTQQAFYFMINVTFQNPNIGA